MAKIFNLSDLWNNAGEAYAGIKMSVQNLASSASSKLLDLAVDGTSKFSVDPDGVVTGTEFVGKVPTSIVLTALPESTQLYVQDDIVKFKMPFAMNLSEIDIFLAQAHTGSNFTLSIDIGLEFDYFVLLSSGNNDTTVDDLNVSLAKGQIITLNINTVGSEFAGAGLKVTLTGKREV